MMVDFTEVQWQANFHWIWQPILDFVPRLNKLMAPSFTSKSQHALQYLEVKGEEVVGKLLAINTSKCVSYVAQCEPVTGATSRWNRYTWKNHSLHFQFLLMDTFFCTHSICSNRDLLRLLKTKPRKDGWLSSPWRTENGQEIKRDGKSENMS